jgi:hypothetical protein
LNTSQTPVLNLAFKQPGNPGTVSFSFSLVATILRVVPAATLTSAETGEHLYELQVNDGIAMTRIDVKVKVTNQPMLFLLPQALPPAAQDVPYSSSMPLLEAFGPVQYMVTAGFLPAGLLLDMASGSLNGTPRESGDWSFAVDAWDSTGGHASQMFSLQVAAAPPPPREEILVLGETPAGCAGVPGGFRLSAAVLPLLGLAWLRRRAVPSRSYLRSKPAR